MRARGFTFIELLLVLTLVALLASLAAPVVSQSILRARESVLKEDLFVMRKALDDYYADTGAYVSELAVLVDKRYLRRLPVDPFTERSDSWVAVPAEEGGGVVDVRSGSEAVNAAGVSYAEW